MNDSTHSELTLFMTKILHNGNYVGLSTLLSKIIRNFLEYLTKNEQQQR
jgi:hypothetical protein